MTTDDDEKASNWMLLEADSGLLERFDDSPTITVRKVADAILVRVIKSLLTVAGFLSFNRGEVIIVISEVIPLSSTCCLICSFSLTFNSGQLVEAFSGR